MSSFPSASTIKLTISYVAGFIAAAYCVYVAATGIDPQKLQVLLCVLAALLGWIVGILLTPSSEDEKKQFGEWAKSLVAAGTGFTAGKIDAISHSALATMTGADSTLFGTRAALCAVSFILGALFTFVARKYWTGSGAEQRAKRAKTIGEIRKKLDELQAADP